MGKSIKHSKFLYDDEYENYNEEQDVYVRQRQKSEKIRLKKAAKYSSNSLDED